MSVCIQIYIVRILFFKGHQKKKDFRIDTKALDKIKCFSHKKINPVRKPNRDRRFCIFLSTVYKLSFLPNIFEEILINMSNVVDGDEIRTSADLTGADFQAKLAKTRNDVKLMKAKEASGKTLTAAQKKKKDAMANIDVTAHKVSCQVLESQLEKVYKCPGAGGILTNGLTDSQVAMGQAEFGPNALTPPPETPEWLKCLETQKGFFNLLLWAGSILCFISYGIDNSAPDNLYLGIVLAFVVIATGVFEYFQEKSSSGLMKKFANMQPPQVTVKRNGVETAIPAAQLTHVSSSALIHIIALVARFDV